MKTPTKHDARVEALTSSDFEHRIREPRRLIFDLETAPHTAHVWGHWQQNVLSYISKGYIMSVGYRWVGEKTAHVVSLPDFEGYTGGDSTEKELVQFLWNLFDEADILIAHNGASFDVKVANSRFIKHKMKPPSFYRVIDTKVEAKKVGRFSSNKLDHLGDELDLGRKLQHQGFDLWLGCMAGDMKCWNKMNRYCKQDVNLEYALYEELRPWMASHPNINVLMNRESGCSKCGAPPSALVKRGYANGRAVDYAWTNQSTAQRYHCKNCGGYSQDKYKRVSSVRSSQ